MQFRRLAFLIGLTFANSFSAMADSPPAEPAMPTVLGKYLVDGRIGVDDLGWMRGRFPHASLTDQANWQEIKKWLEGCQQRATAHVREELISLGVQPTALQTDAYEDESCALVLFADFIANKFDSWTTFEAARKEALPYYLSYRYASEVAGAVAEPDDPTAIGERLRAAFTVDQILRHGAHWQGHDEIKPPELSGAAKQVLLFLLSREFVHHDFADTAMLRSIISSGGWPKSSVVGKTVAFDAWLLVQHADADPAFQLRVLRLMEPMVKAGDVDPGDYAALFDRTMLKITGHQDYGTQFLCVAGRYEPKGLTDMDGVDIRRKSVGLGPLAIYRKTIESSYGTTCTS